VSAADGPQRPRLVAVPGGPAAGEDGARSPEPAAPAPSAPRAPARPWLAIVLAVALALCAAALYAQGREVSALRGQLAQVEAQLARAEARLGAWQLWAGGVRDRAARLRAELGGLEAALAQDPEAAPGAHREPGAPPASAGELRPGR